MPEAIPGERAGGAGRFYRQLAHEALDAAGERQRPRRRGNGFAWLGIWPIDAGRPTSPGHQAGRSLQSTGGTPGVSEGEIRFGRVLAGELSIGGAPYTAYWFQSPDGKTGSSMRPGQPPPGLLRAPLQVPAHLLAFEQRSAASDPRHGTAPRGAPTMPRILGTRSWPRAMARSPRPGGPVDTVIWSSRWHANGITTRHRSPAGVCPRPSAGDRVVQGQVIGYVGSTARHGPHLHDDFRVAGVSRDPGRVDLGSVSRRTAPFADFERERARLDSLLHPPASTLVAVAD